MLFNSIPYTGNYFIFISFSIPSGLVGIFMVILYLEDDNHYQLNKVKENLYEKKSIKYK